MTLYNREILQYYDFTFFITQMRLSSRNLLLCLCVFTLLPGCFRATNRETLEPIRTIAQWQDYQRRGLVPKEVQRIYCSGGTLRLITYLQCADRVVATDGNERNTAERNGMKAYLAAYPELQRLPIAGQSSGRDNPELLLSLKNPPQLIIKADTQAGFDPRELTRRTGIPVLLVPMRGITVGREQFDEGLRLIGAALDKSDRAEDIIQFIDTEIEELRRRTADAIPPGQTAPLVYVGGVSYNGSHGFHSSEAAYPPLELVGARTPISEKKDDPLLGNRHQLLSREMILQWDPEVLFLDLGTLNLQEMSGLHELRNDPSYRALTAVRQGKVYAFLPNTFYFVNHDAVLANAYFAGKTLYPDRFEDVDPKRKADEIFTFLLARPVFEELNAPLQNLALNRVPLE